MKRILPPAGLALSALLSCTLATPSGLGDADSGRRVDATVIDAADSDNDAGSADAGSDDSGNTPKDAGTVDPCAEWMTFLELDRQMMANPGFGRRQLDRPIILHHGMAGFTDLGPMAYFSGIPDHLRALGFEVFLTQVDPIAGSVTRAPQLAQQLRCINRIAGSDGVHLVGHSQGGIDGRMVAAAQGDERLIVSLTTVAAPHRGSAAADAFLRLPAAGRGPITRALMGLYSGLVGRPNAEADLHRQMVELSTEFMADLNTTLRDHPEVTYRSWAGRSVAGLLDRDLGQEVCGDAVYPNPQRRDIVDPLFALFHPIVLRAQGPNDGLIAVESAKWGRFMGCVPADHLDEVGMMGDPAPQRFSGFNYLALFETIAGDL